jgi:hypothetical protein
MIDRPTAVFLINLVQDVNVLRPLMLMASRYFDYRCLFLVSHRFAGRDLYGIWRRELELLRAETKAVVQSFENDWEAFRKLEGHGLVFAGSESSVSGHQVTHSILRYAPPGFLTVTLQHGFECVGFRHSAAHDRAHGEDVGLSADILCSWQPPALQPAVAGSQRPKVLVTGPTSALQMFAGPRPSSAHGTGIVAENLHSVRMSGGDLKKQFVQAFDRFCGLLAVDNRSVILRPHPGGQYVLKNKVEVPANARIDNAPMYRLDLRQFAYGISAPSSVLIDMLLAGIPTAVWRDEGSGVDTDNYPGLASVTTPAEWLDFSREAVANPQPFLERQKRFLREQKMPLEPVDVAERFAQLFRTARTLGALTRARPAPKRRILFVANAHLPTLQICLERPLAAVVGAGEVETELLTEPEIRRMSARSGTGEEFEARITEICDGFNPDVLIFSRYSGPEPEALLGWARKKAVPVIYHIDDDLLAVPRELGERKHAYHNDPLRLKTVNHLLGEADCVYASTEPLAKRLRGYHPEARIVAGAINCSGRILRPPVVRPARVIGYTGFDHFADLMMVLPALVETLDRHPELRFEIFGTIAVPPELDRFGDRVRTVAPIRNYDGFLDRLVELDWDIGICPLTPSEFNLYKSNNKWIEYSAAGIATITSANMIYDECCADGCGILAADLDEWRSGLERLVTDSTFRVDIVGRAQRKMEGEYGVSQHRGQILELVDRVMRQVAEAGPEQKFKVEA